MSDLPGGHEVRDAVNDVLVRYATSIDQRDWELFRTCFTGDCEADYGDIGRWRGVDELTSWMAETHEPLGHSMHRISNVAVCQEVDQVTARSYVHAVLVLSDHSAVHAYGYYDDDVVMSDDGPKIARRRFTQVTTELHAPMA